MKTKAFQVVKGGQRQSFVKWDFQETVGSLNFHVVACVFKI